MIKQDKKYIRVGSCNRCGKCCKADHLLEACTDQEKRILRNLARDKKIEQKLAGFRCKHVWFKKRKARCKIYENRPEFCKYFPTGPDDIVAECGFKFKELVKE